MTPTFQKASGWALTGGLLLALVAWPGAVAAQRAVSRGGSGGTGGPAPQTSAPSAPQGARQPSAPRDNGGSSGAPVQQSSGGSSDSTRGAPRADSRDAGPYGGRPRNGPATGTAVARTSPPRHPGGPVNGSSVYYYPLGYYPWGWGGYGFGAYYGYGFGAYYGFGYGPSYAGGYYGGYDPWGYGYGYPRDYSIGYTDDGAVRLKVKPSDAAVFVDGYFAGQVDNFDGTFQRLHVEPGPHRIEVRAAGYQPLFFDIRILPGRTVTYTGELKRD